MENSVKIRQQYNSADTSINKTKLPAIFNKLDWEALSLARHKNGSCLVVLDYGAGRYTEHIRDFLTQYGILYFPYDPYNLPKKVNEISKRQKPDVVICSNVLNVIKENEIIEDIRKFIKEKQCLYFITVYEGDGFGVGKETKEKCWQRNEKLSAYGRAGEIIYKSAICGGLSENENIRQYFLKSKK